MNDLTLFEIKKFIEPSNNLIIDYKNISFENSITLVFNKIYFLDKFELDLERKIGNVNTIKYSNINISISGTFEKIRFNECKFDEINLKAQSTKFELEVINSEIKNMIIKNLNSKVQKTVLKNEYIEYDKKILLNSNIIENLEIKGCKFFGKLYINKHKTENEFIKNRIDNLLIEDTIFFNHFKLQSSLIKSVKLKDIDFEANADFFNCKFLVNNTEELIIEGINFKKLAYFDDTYFNKKLIFRHVNFEGNTSFKNSKLEQGLDLEYANIEKEINFHNMNILNTNTTTQETYRIIKYQLEKLSNKIEANKYHSLELEMKKKSLYNKSGNYRYYVALAQK